MGKIIASKEFVLVRLMSKSSSTVPVTSGFLAPFKTGFKALMKTRTEGMIIFLLRNKDSDTEIATPGKV